MSNKTDWEGALGANWAAQANRVGRLLGPFGRDAMDALGDVSGKRILDLGCGDGTSTFELARRGAQAIGVDVSPDLIAMAEKRRSAATGPAGEVKFRLEDASAARFERRFDGLYSRFGAMFFDEPAAAYAHLRSAMKSGAPLAIACWRTPRENEWAYLPLKAAKEIMPPTPPADRRAPGPFAWSEPEESFAPMLAEAGWRDVAWAPVEHAIALNSEGAEDPIESALAFTLEIGPLASRLREAPEDLREAAKAAVREALATRLSDTGVVKVAGAGWVVTARA